jgi:hypothetical protein
MIKKEPFDRLLFSATSVLAIRYFLVWPSSFQKTDLFCFFLITSHNLSPRRAIRQQPLTDCFSAQAQILWQDRRFLFACVSKTTDLANSCFLAAAPPVNWPNRLLLLAECYATLRVFMEKICKKMNKFFFTKKNFKKKISENFS